MTGREKAAALNQRALELKESGQSREAARLYRRAAAADPGWSVPWYNLGLLYKQERKWKLSLECNRRAAELNPKDDAAWWNLGIAATALGRWKVARAAWRGFGIDLPEGRGPIDFPCGFGPIRLNCEGPGKLCGPSALTPRGRSWTASRSRNRTTVGETWS